jgi:UDP-N-acetylmuramate--alanine ligase
VLNALSGIVVAQHEGLTFEQIQKAATSFKGAFRRFNILTPPNSNITVIDDYAHHPTEVQTTINAARLHFPDRRLIVIYRPHTYSRTQTLLKEYQQAFSGADKLYMCDVEPARELANQRTVSGQEIIDGLPPKLTANTKFQPKRDELVDDVLKEAKPGDVILCMTVSGYENLANELAEKV